MSQYADIGDYQILQLIDIGAYGEVFKARCRKTARIVAIKRIRIEAQTLGIPTTTLREIGLLKELSNNPNVVRFIEVVVNSGLCIVMDYLETNLKKHIEKPRITLASYDVKNFLKQLLTGIADCHARRIIHRDLKPANILLSTTGDKKNNLKIADFGLARTYTFPHRPYTNQVVTLYYRAPQILLGVIQYSTPIDIWSIGCIFAEMVLRKPLFKGQSQQDQLIRIFRTLGTPNQEIWPGFTSLKKYSNQFPDYQENNLMTIFQQTYLCQNGKDLLKSMLRYQPEARISARDALRHSYFNNMIIDQ